MDDTPTINHGVEDGSSPPAKRQFWVLDMHYHKALDRTVYVVAAGPFETRNECLRALVTCESSPQAERPHHAQYIPVEKVSW